MMLFRCGFGDTLKGGWDLMFSKLARYC